jgi:hypothetical protein
MNAVTKLFKLDPGKEVSNLKRSRILCIRAMNRILANRRSELLANRTFLSLRRVGRAHQLAQVGNRIILFEHHRKDGSARHKLRQFAKERPRRVNVVEALGLSLGDRKPLDRNNLKPCLFNLGEDGCRVALTNGVRLDDAECAL